MRSTEGCNVHECNMYKYNKKGVRDISTMIDTIFFLLFIIIMKDIPDHSYAWTAPQATINATWTSSLYYNPISHWNQFYHCCLTPIPYYKRHYFVLAPAQTLHDNLLAWAARTATGWTFSWLLKQTVVKAKVKTKD